MPLSNSLSSLIVENDMPADSQGRCLTCGQALSSTLGCTYCADPRAQSLLRWIRVSQLAGAKLETWYKKHNALLARFLPMVPKIADTLKRGDLDEMERLLS